jgi:hypothetical protein
VTGEDRWGPYTCFHVTCVTKRLWEIAKASGVSLCTERSHAPVIIGGVGLDGRKPGDFCVLGSEVTHRIGCGGIAGEREGLTAASAKIQLAARATCAWLLHPCGAAEGVEGRGIRPDIGERTLAHVPEFKAGNRLGGVTGQHLARWRDIDGTTAPTADARLG